ncbi:hypothetical protein FHY30_003428 [Xanthomonas arboricola]|nr:hypothetical protein [Xanthomonas campestris]
MTAELLRVGCIAHHQRLALSHSCSCSDRSSAQLSTTPATSLQSLQIPRVDPSIALSGSFSKCLDVHHRLHIAVTLALPNGHWHLPSITRRGICSQRHELRGLPASGCPSPTPGSVCQRPTTNDQRPATQASSSVCQWSAGTSFGSYLPVAGQYELRELAASGQPAQSVPISTPLKGISGAGSLGRVQSTERLLVTRYVNTARSS